MKGYIRRMSDDDIKEVYQILIHSDAMSQYTHISEETLLQQFKWVNKSNMHDHYVIEIDSICVGYGVIHWMETFLYEKPEGYISELFIHERFRGNGLGTELLDFMIDRAKERDCCRVWLLNTMGSESNSRKYYHKQGWMHSDKDMRYILYLNH